MQPQPAMKSAAAQVLVRLQRISAAGELDTPQRLARLVARVLVSQRLKQRRKWCDVARSVAADPSVEDRLIQQAMHWLSIQPGKADAP
jgi:Holliday junction resolvase-like predicted endonuclease